MNKRSKKGFTLIELMIVVVIVGILAAIAIPAYNSFTAKAKESEFTTMLGSMKTGETIFFTDSGYDVNGNPQAPRFITCPNSHTAVPAGYKVAGTGWTNAAWAAIGITTSEPTLARYRATWDGDTGALASVTTTAEADLDGDGTSYSITMTGTVGATGDATWTGFAFNGTRYE